MNLRAFGRDVLRAVTRSTPAYDSPQAWQNAVALRRIAAMIPADVGWTHAGATAGEIRLAALLRDVRNVAIGRDSAAAAHLPPPDWPAPDQVLEGMERLLANTGWLQVEARTRDGGRTIEGSCVDDRGRPWQWRRDSDGTNTLVRDAV